MSSIHLSRCTLPLMCTEGFAPFPPGLRRRSGDARRSHGVTLAFPRALPTGRTHGATKAPGLACTTLGFLVLAVAAMAPLVPVDAHATDLGRGASWTAHNHPCPGGNRTDDLHRDVDGTLWVGCGTNASGYGLFRSSDGGVTWSAPATTPADYFNQYRVLSISRGHDGALYAAGTNAQTGNNDMVVRVATGGTEPFAVTPTLTGVAQLGYSFLVGTYRELSDGRALAESQNGTDILYRSGPGIGATATDWQAVDGFPQIADLVVHGDGFYASGSRNVEPPRVFLPPTTPGGQPYQFVTLDLQPPSGWQGELWGLAVNARRLVAAGVNQDDNRGRIFVSGADPYAAAAYTEFNLSTITGDNFSWARGVCMKRDRIVVVGERQPLGGATGRAVISDDGGASFSNITPPGVAGSISRCVIEPDGSVVVAGAGGYIGIRQDPDWIFVEDFERP